MSAPPPPPPPHGESPKTTAGGGLPPGKYDIFIIPEHSAGSGFLYLPSMRPNTNSFVAGFACALALVVIGQSMAPAFQAWWANFQGMGNAGMMLLVVAVGLGAWSLGRQQQDGSSSSRSGGGSGSGFNGGAMPGGGGFSSAGPSPNSNTHSNPPPPNSAPPPKPQPAPPGGMPPGGGSSWHGSPPQPGTSRAQPQAETPPHPETPKNSWEKKREEVRRKEEERKVKEAEQKRRDEAAQRLKELREKEARERAKREQEKQRREAEIKEKEAKEREAKEKEEKEREAKLRKDKELNEARQKEIRERLSREREERRKKLEDEKKRKEAEEAQRKSTGYSYSGAGVGEKTNPWPNGKPPAASPSPSPTKQPPPPTARTVGDEDAYSYRPYDKPKRPAHRKSNSDMSQSSWAPSQSTAPTTPPASVRGPYSTKDPDKIVIKAVYSFMNQFAKMPATQLISGTGSVTDGLILRITTEGLFIDDDVRGVAQREWDVKAWTLKLVEVWCPSQFLASAIASTASPGSKNPQSPGANLNTAFFAKKIGSQRLKAAERGAPKAVTGNDADTALTDLLKLCKDSCRLGSCASKFANLDHDDTASSTSSRTNGTSTTSQTGDWKAKGLHLLRATVRDQEGKRYLFVIGEEEGWKMAVGLQRLRGGTQVRALGVAGLSGLETKNTLEMLGWG